MYIYNIINNRGVLKEGTPFVLGEKPLTLCFEGIYSGTFAVNLIDRNGKIRTETVIDNVVSFDRAKLQQGLYYVELLELSKSEVINKWICSPISILSATAPVATLMAYPDIDETLKRIARLEAEMASHNLRLQALEKIAHQQSFDGHPEMITFDERLSALEPFYNNLIALGGNRNEKD